MIFPSGRGAGFKMNWEPLRVECRLLVVKHCGSEDESEFASIVLCVMLKIWWKSKETVAVSSLLGWLNWSLHEQRQKRGIKK